jgi:hypothetical protein
MILNDTPEIKIYIYNRLQNITYELGAKISEIAL